MTPASAPAIAMEKQIQTPTQAFVNALQASRGISPDSQVRFGYHPDSKRFDDLIKGKQRKEDLFKYIARREMKVGKDGKIRFPMPRIDQPDFRRDSSGQGGGGQGMGEGEVGDEVQPGQPGDGPGGEGAGEGEGEHSREHWGPPYSPSEIAKMIGEDLKLPNLKPKSKGKMRETTTVWNSRHQNPPGRKLLRPTMIRALKREASQAKHRGEEFDPRDLQLIRPDFQRLSWKTKTKPSSKTVIFYLMDVSGSVSNEMKERARTNNFILSTYLKYQYGLLSAQLNKRKYNDKEFFGKGVEEKFIIHDDKAKPVSEDEFYTTTQSGGTKISSAFKEALTTIRNDYPPDQWNVYVFYYGDGDNWGNDNDEVINLIEEMRRIDVNLVGYVNLESRYGSYGQNFKKVLSQKYGENNNFVRIADLGGDDYTHYKKAIRPLLEERNTGGKK